MTGSHEVTGSTPVFSTSEVLPLFWTYFFGHVQNSVHLFSVIITFKLIRCPIILEFDEAEFYCKSLYIQLLKSSYHHKFYNTIGILLLLLAIEKNDSATALSYGQPGFEKLCKIRRLFNALLNSYEWY